MNVAFNWRCNLTDLSLILWHWYYPPPPPPKKKQKQTNINLLCVKNISPYVSLLNGMNQVERVCGIPIGLQKLVKDGELLPEDVKLDDGFEITCIKDETPMYTWDIANNPCAKQLLAVDGNILRCPNLKTDYVNVLTQEPIRSGIHYYEFHLHHVGDEQWCGVTMDPAMAGSDAGGRALRAWTYYCGRSRSTHGTVVDGKGALHANGRAIIEFEKACTAGNVINMLVDADQRLVAFGLNGQVQGACRIPGTEPLYLLTHVDKPEDHVELRKPVVEDAPQDMAIALTTVSQISWLDRVVGTRL